MKLDRGGDGVAHHRSTSDEGRHDKRVYQCGPLSNVRFRARNRPPLSDFVRIIRKEEEFLIKFLDNSCSIKNLRKSVKSAVSNPALQPPLIKGL